jgi:hypothetical protein
MVLIIYVLVILDFANTSNTWQSSFFTIGYNTGNVGIGTRNQSQKLYVNGTTYFNGNSTV